MAKAWSSLCIPTNIGAGDDIYQREGREIRLASLLLRLRFDNTKSYTYPLGGASYAAVKRCPQVVRLIVIWDKYPNGVQAGTGDVFQVAGDSGGAQIENVMAPMELKNRRRFKVLSDQLFSLGVIQDMTCNSTGQINNPNTFFAGSPPPVKYITKYIKLKGKSTTYGSTAATIGATNEGAIYVWCATSVWGPLDGTISGSIQGEACGVIGTCRLRYTG